MCGAARPARASVASSAWSRARSSGLVACEALHGEPGDHHPLQQHQVERDARDLPDANPTVTNRPPQRRARSACSAFGPPTGSMTTSAPAAGDLLDPRLEVLGAVVDRRLGPRARGTAPASRPRRPRPRTRAPSTAAQLHGGQADAAGGAEHHDPLPGLDPGHAAQRVVGGRVGHARRRRRGQVDRRVDRLERGAGTTTCSANAPTSVEPITRSPTATPVHAGPDAPARCRRTRCPP